VSTLQIETVPGQTYQHPTLVEKAVNAEGPIARPSMEELFWISLRTGEGAESQPMNALPEMTSHIRKSCVLVLKTIWSKTLGT
jgi:hypothetical protein